MPIGISSSRITGITSIRDSDDVVSKEYIDARAGGAPDKTNQEAEFLYTDGSIYSWEHLTSYTEYKTPGSYTHRLPDYAKHILIEAIGGGGGGEPGNASGGGSSGGSGGSGAYSSWQIIKDQIVGFTLNIFVGSGGTGGTASPLVAATSGQASTVSWTGPNSATYTLSAAGGGAASGVTGGSAGAADVGTDNFLVTSSGIAGVNGLTGNGTGTSATTSSTAFQATAGGGGGFGSDTNNFGGNGGTINYYGNTATAVSVSVNGTNGPEIAGLAYGGGGSGGGGNSTPLAGNGGNGSRGGGGGGGGYGYNSILLSSAVGNGGNGGSGYVKVTWW